MNSHEFPQYDFTENGHVKLKRNFFRTRCILQIFIFRTLDAFGNLEKPSSDTTLFMNMRPSSPEDLEKNVHEARTLKI